MRQKKSEGECRGPYFAAANSGRGFISFYDDVFGKREIVRRYLIKGGPGTGKSSFMRKVAECALSLGKSVELYRCSSDPDSLDGIVIDGSIAILDATAPHSEDTKVPGARDELVNLGAFWDSEALTRQYDRIFELNEKKAVSYKRAYRFLSACLEVEGADRLLLDSCIKKEKMRRAVHRLCENLPNGKGFSVEPRLLDSIGMKGRVHFDSFEREARKLYWLDDEYGIGSDFLAALVDEAMEKQCAVQVSREPISPDRLSALRFCESGVCVVIGNQKTRPMPEGAVRVNLKRFLDLEALGEVKRELRANRRLREALLSSAEGALAEAGAYHFELEKIYVACMDFEAEGRFRASFCEHILKLV
ncbi:MAG: hypothetical protein J6Q64_04225 [Clostridia bacterium]|nr:hypothetical protein [Clostridia bacterium]